MEETELRDQFRAKMNAMLREEPFLTGLSHIAIAETLVASAFAFCDFNGGVADTEHAAKVLRRMVDKEVALRL